ncbi:MAG: hypothetical protein KDB82_13940 [Planctomycetes bacterium]|nr:hypothetical protein [Planctomycetota bacterium]
MKLAGSVALLLLTAVVFAGSLSAVAPGDQGPNFKFDKSWNIEDGMTELSQFRGKVVMIESWATW